MERGEKVSRAAKTKEGQKVKRSKPRGDKKKGVEEEVQNKKTWSKMGGVGGKKTILTRAAS